MLSHRHLVLRQDSYQNMTTKDCYKNTDTGSDALSALLPVLDSCQIPYILSHFF